jgi:sugar transferase (PEP-CTERM/EpsH1 system associated)
MVQHLSKSHEVTVASLTHTNQELRDALPLRNYCAEVIAEVLPNAKRWSNSVLTLPTTFPSSAAYFRSGRLARRIEENWRKARYDGVLVHCAFAAQYALPLRGGFRIMDYGDLDSAKWADYSTFRSFPLSTGYSLESAKLRRFEKFVAESSAHCTFTTRGEAEAFRTLAVSKPLTVIPNGVDTRYFHREVQSATDSKVLVFLGRMDYFPNIDGICWFARELFQPIRSRAPGAKLRIVGSNPVRAVRKLAEIEGVTVTGFVPDVRPYLADAAIAIAPLRLARGTQNKILECMGMGIPVVTTPEAARGIQANAGEHLLVAGTPEGFIQSVVELLENPSLRAQLGEAGRLQAESAHQWPASMRILDEVLQSVSAARDIPAPA